MSEPVRFADELPPLPEPTGYMAHDYHLKAWGERDLRAYAAQAVAERDAEIGRLRGENKALQDGIVRDFVDVGVKNAIAELRAEVEALRRIKSTNAPRIEALEGLLAAAQIEVAVGKEARATLASERAANALLTAEVEALKADAERHYAAGWIAAAKWAERDDLISDIDSPAYIADRDAAIDRARSKE